MLNKYNIEYKEYAPILRRYGFTFSESSYWLQVGENKNKEGWELFLSVKTVRTLDLFEKIHNLLSREEMPFKIIKNQFLSYQLNGGLLGEEMIGKVIALYPPTVEKAITITSKLQMLTDSYRGPKIQDAIRLGQVLYATYYKERNNIYIKSPFKVEKKYLPPKRKPFTGKYYILYEGLQTTHKGDIYKAINLKNFSLTWCLIKRGNANAVEDQKGRDIKQRILWEKSVIEALQGQVSTPRVLDYFEANDDSYLVTEYIEGVSLTNKVDTLYKNKSWVELGLTEKKEILDYYLKIVELVSKIHKAGYVHRDLTDSNFIFSSKGEVYIIDFEISYNYLSKSPNPAFVMGTNGYVAPEQINYCEPRVTEDIYSLGALLLFLLTGVQPKLLFQTSKKKMKTHLICQTSNVELVGLSLKCLDQCLMFRPTIDQIISEIKKYQAHLNCKNVKIVD